jgi:GNAT superfamily N-acetyltransferase
VPNLGPIIAAIPAVAVAFFEGSTWIPLSNAWFAVLVLGLYILIQQIEGNVLLPRVMGRSLDLHPLAVLVAVIAGGSLAGILGMLLAAPTLATLRVLLKYLYRRLTDQDPFPEKQQPEPSRPGLARRLWYRLRRQSLADRWTIRPAQPEDRPGMEALCAQIWDGEDYVPSVWDEWLADPQGELTVVTLEGQVVALGKLTRLAEDEWWMEGLRVDPDYRRLGIARLLQAHQLALAEQIGDGILRFGTASNNQTIHRSAARDGFHRVAEFSYYKSNALPGPSSARLLTPDEEEDVWKLIAGSPIREAAAGLYELDWRWMKLTRDRLAAHLAAGEVWGIDWQEQLAALAILPVDPERENLSVAYLDGNLEAITTLVWILRSHADRQGLPMLRVRPPSYPPLEDAIEAAGISTSLEVRLWIFERPLGQLVSSTPASETEIGDSYSIQGVG